LAKERTLDDTTPMPVELATDSEARPRVQHATPLQVAAAWVFSVVVRLWCRTLRFEGSASDFASGRHDEPSVVLLWHNRLFLVPWALKNLRYMRPVCGLVSASRDGANLAALFKFIGIRTVRGSSSRLGREALQELIRQCREGNDVAVTPDGPRGPVYSMRPGAVLAARRVNAPMVLLGFHCTRAWRLGSWDRFLIPWPFSRVVLRSEVLRPLEIGRGNDAVAHVRRRLLELSGETCVPEEACQRPDDS
jgi:lysophospholipid acyltransferase (LPLAT)-like uncharacterized protein